MGGGGGGVGGGGGGGGGAWLAPLPMSIQGGPEKRNGILPAIYQKPTLNNTH